MTPIYLGGKPIYKLSMGYLGAQSRLLDELWARHWLVVDGVAGRGQGERFKQVENGTFVYVCTGSWSLWGIYRLVGNWSKLPDELAELLPSDSDWGYRPAEFIAAPTHPDTRSLKHVRQFWAPSGNSTFFQVSDLAQANESLFEPFFDRTLFAGAEGTDDELSHKFLSTVFPLNQILYGPPGTGKTYHTVAKAVALLSGTSDEDIASQYPPEKRGELRQRFEDYRQAQRIEFVTFHQAFSYEDFVEGIKPIAPEKDVEGESSTTEAKPVQYAVEKGVFRRICESAAAAANTAAAPVLPAFDTLYDDFVAQLAERMESTKGSLTFYSKTSVPITLTSVSLDNPLKRLTFLHANSGQQDHHIDKTWIKKLYDKYQSIDQVQHLTNDITKAVGGSNATLMWVVFNELKQYEAARIAQERAKQQTTPPPPFVLIIDEINRGNVANIFGELITLLEDDKRAGGTEALTVTLPYSKEKFAVPSNLYVLGTMNTADRSVEALDTALRRRFSFTEMLPRPDLLPTDVEGINLRELLTAINARLEQLLDHDHCIGHALLIHVKTLDQLREAFRRSILPLLQEYFFGDWGKIGLVLGTAFITQVNKKAGATGYKLLSFGSYSTGELSEKPVYRLTDTQQVPTQAFQAIYAV